MPQELDILKITKYPPEIFFQARPFDLAAGENKVVDYAEGTFKPYYLCLYGMSFARYDGLGFSAEIDGAKGVIEIGDLGAIKGLDYEEELKYPAVRSMILYITNVPAGGITAYQYRHKVLVMKPNTLLRLLLDQPLLNEDKRLAEKYRLREFLATQLPMPFDPYQGIEKIFTFSGRLSASGTIFRMSPHLAKSSSCWIWLHIVLQAKLKLT